MRQSRPFLILAIGLILSGCAGHRVAPSADPRRPVGQWSAAHGRSHPLTGRIWETASERFVDTTALTDALGRARFVLLGEKHDNPDHHRIQAWVVGRMIAHGRRPTVVFEMFSSDQQSRLARYLARPGADAAGIGDAVGWKKTGWPNWRHYAPIAQAALDGGAPIAAGNLPRSLVRKIARKGLDALDGGRVAALGLNVAPPASLESRMRQSIRASHCNQLPERMVGPMVQAQRARDAAMAKTTAGDASGATFDGAVLIAGGEHVRTDYGVPWHLRRSKDADSIAAVGLIEVDDDRLTPAAYRARFGAGKLPFDFVWFTPRVDDENPCEKYADQLQHMRKRGAAPGPK
jgi:uncharacterized iron-regulated protein